MNVETILKIIDEKIEYHKKRDEEYRDTKDFWGHTHLTNLKAEIEKRCEK